MSGPFGSSQWMYSTGANGFYPQTIEQSLRLNDDDGGYLSRTPASAGDRKVWTWSCWVKRANLNSVQHLLRANLTMVRFTSSNTLEFQRSGGSVETTAVFRDNSAWYNIVFAVDTTQATSSDRVKLYVNGVQQTLSGTFPAQNTDYDVNNSIAHYIGQSGSSSEFLDGYLAEVHFIDGQALAATNFGLFKSGVWVAKSYAGTYGTNGFRLTFANSANIGDDTSGNTNDWAATNIAATDVVLDSPTNNWCALNPLTNTGGTFTEGNLQYSGPSAFRKMLGTIGLSTGKWYWEVAVLNSPKSRSSASENNSFGFSLVNSTGVTTINGDGEALALADNGYVQNFSSGSWIDTGTTVASGDILSCAVDLGAGTYVFKRNNVTVRSGGIESGSVGKVMIPHQTSYNGSFGKMFCNFGQDSSFGGNKTAQGNTDTSGIGDFYYQPPSGYLAICTSNLPAPAIDPAQGDSPDDYFNAVLYTGNGGTQSITGVGFQPDLLWIKKRNTTSNHALNDIVRGINKYLFTDSANVEIAFSGGVSSLDPDGFTLATGDTGWNKLNDTYIGFSWYGSNSTYLNTYGMIDTTVSANTKAGFSIAGYTGTGSDSFVGNGLDAVTELVMIKRRDSETPWIVGSPAIGRPELGKFLRLNTTDSVVTDINMWAGQPFQYNRFAIGGTNVSEVNSNGGEYVAYSFASVEGYSKIGSYTGDGLSDGHLFVHTGFRPAFVMIKRIDSTGAWYMWDTIRDTSNVQNVVFSANTNAGEATNSSYNLDLLSSGFKLRSNFAEINASGGTYFYMAFAEAGGPFKYALAR